MLIVTGMHRSGTSFAAQAIQLLGGSFGNEENLIAADQWNAKGYLEAAPVVDINNRLVLGSQAKLNYWESGRRSAIARVVMGLRAGKWKYFFKPDYNGIARRAEQYRSEIAQCGQTYQDLFVKDPRFCLTLDQWTSRVPVNGVVFSYRTPMSVARSVQRREHIPKWVTLRLWAYHVQSFLLRCPSVPMVVVNFDRILAPETQDEEFERLRRFVSHFVSDFQDIRVDEILDKKLITSSSPAQDIYPPDVTRTLSALEKLWQIHDGPVIYQGASL